MHHCLCIPEILQIICEHVGILQHIGVYIRGQHRDLLAMALVCHGFYDTSLNQLWRKIHSIYPLLTCLPSDIWSGPLTRDNAVLARAITPSDIGHFKAHAHRVQSYGDTHYHLDIPIAIYQALSFHFHDQPIFPNLVKVIWGSDKNEIFPYISMFLGPSIRQMEVHISGDSVPNSMLPTLGKRCPSLVHFCLYNTEHRYFPDTGRQMKSPLSQWGQLETLIIHYLPEESLRVVAGLPYLRSLSLTYADDGHGNTFSPTPDTSVFPALQNLSVTANSPILCINLLRAATNCLLKEFTFSLFGLNPPIWDGLFTALAESCNKDTLTTIRINDLAVKSGEQGPSTKDDLRVLFTFTGLEHLYLTTRYGFGIDDAFMREIAGAWPRIHILDIDVAFITQPFEPQQLTLPGLAPLAEFCPELRTSAVHVDATHMSSNHFDLCSGFKSHVNLLNVGGSPISKESVPWAAACLSAIFPKLLRIWHDDCGNDEPWSEYSTRWAEVQNHLAAYRYVGAHRQNPSNSPDCESNAT